ncbi:MAG: ABC transporter permease [Dehalococcoidia bacterium]
MTRYIVRRLIWLVPVLWFVATITFVLMHKVPGGPFDREKRLPPQTIANLNRKYGLDKPGYEQYGLYLWHAVQGNLGNSYSSSDRPVTTVISKGLQATATLGILALIVCVVSGLTIGIIAALNRNGPLDYFSVFLATIGASTPTFISGLLLIFLFALYLHWLPVEGWGDWQHVVLPVIALAFFPTAYLARITRASMLEVLGQDYVRTARAKGLRERGIVIQHIVKNALIPVLTLIGPIAANLVTGSFIIEFLFSIPGIGRAFVTSVSSRDYGLIMGITLFYAFIIAMANLIVDVLYGVVDPRIRYT